MSIRPSAPESNGFALNDCPLTPAFCQMLAMVEIGIERFARLLDQCDLAMFESLATPNDEQPARKLIRDLVELPVLHTPLFGRAESLRERSHPSFTPLSCLIVFVSVRSNSTA